MLKIGIVGKNYCDSYVSIINGLNACKLMGVFDPSFQFEYPKNFKPELVFLSFEELARKCDAIAFASPEKIYLPLIELALKYSKSVFLHSVHNLSLTEHFELVKLNNEAGEVLQIHQPIIYHDAFIEYQKICTNPLLIEYRYSDNSESKLLVKTRMIVGAVLALFNSNVRKITVNTLSAYTEVPDIIKIHINFDNGGIADLMINTVENQKINQLKCFEYNGFVEIDLDNNKLLGSKNNQSISIKTQSENNFPQKILEKQLTEFIYNAMHGRQPNNCIDNEFITQQVIERVKEKLRLTINIF